MGISLEWYYPSLPVGRRAECRQVSKEYFRQSFHKASDGGVSTLGYLSFGSSFFSGSFSKRFQPFLYAFQTPQREKLHCPNHYPDPFPDSVDVVLPTPLPDLLLPTLIVESDTRSGAVFS